MCIPGGVDGGAVPRLAAAAVREWGRRGSAEEDEVSRNTTSIAATTAHARASMRSQAPSMISSRHMSARSEHAASGRT